MCFKNFCNYELLNCILNFLLLISNSVSMAITCYNLRQVETYFEFILILASLGLSMVCISIKQSLKLETIIKENKIKKILMNKDNLLEIIDEIF